MLLREHLPTVGWVCGYLGPGLLSALTPSIFFQASLHLLIHSLSPSLLSPPCTPFPSSKVHYLSKYFDLQIVEDCYKGGCKNGYLRHMDSNILDYDGAHKPSCPGDASLEEGELLNLLAPFLSEKATLLLESR